MHKINFIFLLLVVCPIFCMQKTQKKLTTFVQKPHLIAFLNKEKVFIGGENGFELINPTTDESITQECFEYQTNKRVYDFAINRSKTKFGITIEGGVIRYNAHTNEREWEKNTSIKGYNSLTFNSQSENQIITHTTTSNRYDDIHTLSSDLAVISHSPGYYVHSPIHCLPTQTAVLWLGDSGNLKETTYFSARGITLGGVNRVYECQYAPDGCNVLFNAHRTQETSDFVYLLSENWMRNIEIIRHQVLDLDHFSTMTFYSQSIFALLLGDNIIEYWNYKKKTLLATTPQLYNINLHYTQRDHWASIFCFLLMAYIVQLQHRMIVILHPFLLKLYSKETPSKGYSLFFI